MQPGGKCLLLLLCVYPETEAGCSPSFPPFSPSRQMWTVLAAESLHLHPCSQDTLDGTRATLRLPFQSKARLQTRSSGAFIVKGRWPDCCRVCLAVWRILPPASSCRRVGSRSSSSSSRYALRRRPLRHAPLRLDTATSPGLSLDHRSRSVFQPVIRHIKHNKIGSHPLV